MYYVKTQIFTPENKVSEILDKIEYFNNDILFKKILEPSFGEGAFLIRIIDRYINIARQNNLNDLEIKNNIEKYIWGVEIDQILFNKTIKRLNKFLKQVNFSEEINWNFYNDDALNINIYKENKFDFIVGNPPYLGNHKLSKELREKYKFEFSFCSSGNYNIYYAFYELFWKLKSDKCKLCYISPNSFIFNKSAKNFRIKLINDNVLVRLDNYQEYKTFLNKTVSVYPAIVLLDSNNTSDSYIYSEKEQESNKFIENIFSFNKFSDKLVNYNFFKIKEKLNINMNETKVKIGYGLATLADKIFICNSKNYFQIEKDNSNIVNFNNFDIERRILKKIVKISTSDKNCLDFRYAIFPYKWNNVLEKYCLIEEQELKNKYKKTYEYLKNKEDQLKNRSITEKTVWYAYGRTQALNQAIHNKKIGVRNLVNGSLVLFHIPKDCLFYSGVYIYSEKEDLESIINILENPLFYEYARKIGKDFSYNHKFISSTDIKQILVRNKKDCL